MDLGIMWATVWGSVRSTIVVLSSFQKYEKPAHFCPLNLCKVRSQSHSLIKRLNPKPHRTLLEGDDDGNMRLIRSVLRYAKFNMSLQLQRYREETSSAHLYPVLIETSNRVHESCVQCCGRSYAASAQPDRLETRRKERKRVPKDERKSMVENYVNRYREMNAGNFPTTSDAKKVVGGSYYVIRQILQELKYNSISSSMDAKEAPSLEKSSVKEDTISKSFETRKGSRSSLSVDASFGDETQLFSAVSDQSKEVGTQSHTLTDEPKSSMHADPQKNPMQGTAHKTELELDRLQHKAESQESTESEVSGREVIEKPTGDIEPQGKSSVWQNLKSFANGILSIWKR